MFNHWVPYEKITKVIELVGVGCEYHLAIKATPEEIYRLRDLIESTLEYELKRMKANLAPQNLNSTKQPCGCKEGEPLLPRRQKN